MPLLRRRPIGDGDLEFLERLYGTTREDELAQVPWDPSQKSAFIRMQFQAQHDYYRKQFPAAEFSVLLLDGEPAGRLYVDRRPDELHVIDIALLPAHRARGIGGRLMRELMDEADSSGIPVRIHVEQFNPARRLYERLGFRYVGDQGVYLLMEYAASGR